LVGLLFLSLSARASSLDVVFMMVSFLFLRGFSFIGPSVVEFTRGRCATFGLVDIDAVPLPWIDQIVLFCRWVSKPVVFFLRVPFLLKSAFRGHQWLVVLIFFFSVWSPFPTESIVSRQFLSR